MFTKGDKGFSCPSALFILLLSKKNCSHLGDTGGDKGICHWPRGDSTQTPNRSSVHSQLTKAVFPGISLSQDDVSSLIYISAGHRNTGGTLSSPFPLSLLLLLLPFSVFKIKIGN